MTRLFFTGSKSFGNQCGKRGLGARLQGGGSPGWLWAYTNSLLLDSYCTMDSSGKSTNLTQICSLTAQQATVFIDLMLYYSHQHQSGYPSGCSGGYSWSGGNWKVISSLCSVG